ncbi:MAG: aminoacetone oxidase family FAD-binding enzyme [Oscillospiraceae bacterium]|nr:aminoacetone oxidase family FAD-binding enzyme [Oscillospiraceae bacterium]
MYYCDIAIIGGGASALAAAIEAARGGAFVYILEKLPRVGKKLLVTGNGRCNLSNLSANTQSFCGDTRIIAPALDKFGEIVEFFESLGLYTRADNEGRLYPMSNAATAVLDALRLECTRLGATELCDFEAVSIEKDEFFRISAADGRKVQAKKIIFACGGKAAPKQGTDGSAFKLLKPFGIKITHLSPALSPLACSAQELRALKGLRAQAAVHAYKNGDLVAQSKGEVQFGENALSGICVFDLAAFTPDELSLDLMPEYTEDDIFNILTDIISRREYATAEDAFTGLFNKRIAQCLLRRVSKLPFNAPCSEIYPDVLHDLASIIKDWRFPVGDGDWDKAQVTCGGIAADELTPELELRRLPDAYACGEALDVHGPCGGFNLHWAWASGRQAASSALAGLR